jgi:hypothetical protein
LAPHRETLSASAKVETADAGGWESAAVANGEASSASANGVERLLAASVRLHIQDDNGQSTGSGTVIDARDGEALILTCGHMFREYRDAGRILVDFFGADGPKQLAGTLVSYDLNSDVGLVRVVGDNRFVAAKVAAPGCQCRSGEQVISIGCDNGRDATPISTTIISVNRYTHAPNLQVAFEPVQGRSGGGLFNAQGEVIGVCNAADAEDKQGLFAALAAIHAELDRTKLSFVYGAQSPVAGTSSESNAVNETPNPAQYFAPHEELSGEEQTLLRELQSARGAEVICLVRGLDDPQAKSRVLQLNRASPAFWRQLAAGSTAEPARKLTSLESRISDPPAVTGETPDATAFSARKSPTPVRTPASADRVWPPRQVNR